MKKLGMKWTQVTNVKATYHMIVSSEHLGYVVSESIVNFLKVNGAETAAYYCRGKVDGCEDRYSFVVKANCSMKLANKACKELEGLIRTNFTDASLWYRTETDYSWDGQKMIETM